MKFRINRNFRINVGFLVDHQRIKEATEQTNKILEDLPSTLYCSIDYKTTSAMVGAIFCDTLAKFTEGVVNPIEKGHPDIIPRYGLNSTEEKLRNFGVGLEINLNP